MLASFVTLQQGRRLQFSLVRLQLVATRNMHTTQPSTLLPTYDEVVNLTDSLVVSLHKINNNMLGKQITVGQLIE
jgi:hypothetical protein